MSDEWLGKRERALENEYFRRQDQELIAKLKEQGRRERERLEIEDRLGLHDPELVTHLQEIGLSPATLPLLHLIPLIEVAWAEGEVTPRERALIVGLAERRGVQPGDAAHAQLGSWLDQRPEQEFFETALEAIRRTLEIQDPQERRETERDLLAWATRIAEATGGILGMMPISREERECLRRLAEGLPDADASAGDRGVTIM